MQRQFIIYNKLKKFEKDWQMRMLAKIILVGLAVSMIQAFPASPTSNAVQTPIPIVSQTNDINGNGNFSYTYETGNGIKLQQAGFVKPIPPGYKITAGAGEEVPTAIQVISGSYAYTAPDGTPIELTYSADENGFHPQGAHLPTAPPLPAAIQSLVNSLPSSTSARK